MIPGRALLIRRRDAVRYPAIQGGRPPSRKAGHEADCTMPRLSAEQRLLADRRVSSDRRSGVERRSGERRKTLTLVKTEQRSGGERRRSRQRRGDAERRSGAERRTEETAAEHIRNALQLVAYVAESGVLDDELRRDLDAAMFRLRFAIDQLERQ